MPNAAARNRRRTTVLLVAAVAVPTVVGLVVGLLVGWPLLALLGLLLGVALAAAAWFRALALVLRGVQARPLPGPGGGPSPAAPSAPAARSTAAASSTAARSPAAPDAGLQRLDNLVDGLCMASGVAKPALYLVDDASPNALAAGVSRSNAAIVVTTGLLDTLNRVELEGVVAHLLARIRRDDVAPATLAAFLLGPLAARIAPAEAPVEADAAAVATTRYPPALAAALTKLRDDPRPVAHAPRASLPLWVVPAAPVDTRRTDPQLDHRIAVLREL